MKLSEIHTNPDNPRFIRDERFIALKKQINEFPKMMKLRPIIVDKDGMILGGNMRYRALLDLGFKDVPDGWIRVADELNEEEKRRFIITDNVPFGQHDWDALANDWDETELEEWGIELPTEWGVDENDFNDEFSLPNAEKGFSQMAFIVTEQQKGVIENALRKSKGEGDFPDTGNENSNGNALERICERF